VAESEKAYSKMQGSYACSLSALAKKNSDGKMFFWDMQLASGKKNGYIYAISSCDAAHYKIVAEPSVPDSGQRAFCSDEGGTIRAATDGKATTCLSSGEAVENERAEYPKHVLVAQAAQPSAEAPAAVQPKPQSPVAPPLRIRVSKGVSSAFLKTKVPPIYPGDAGRIQGAVVLQAIISKTGDVQSLKTLSGPPILVAAAIDAVKQWKYKPYLLNGNPVEVETKITVEFAPSRP